MVIIDIVTNHFLYMDSEVSEIDQLVGLHTNARNIKLIMPLLNTVQKLLELFTNPLGYTYGTLSSGLNLFPY